jgi:hypothetical protein
MTVTWLTAASTHGDFLMSLHSSRTSTANLLSHGCFGACAWRGL